MRAKSQNILAAVFDGTRARFFKQGPAGRLTSLSEMESGLYRCTQEAMSDRQGLGFTSSGSGTQYAYEAKHDKREQAKHDFVHRIVTTLGPAYE